jgi:alpha-glucosidase
MLALMMACLSGTMFIYQGQEIGMVNFPMEWNMSEYKDVDSSNYVSLLFFSRPASSTDEGYSTKWSLKGVEIIPPNSSPPKLPCNI